MKRILRILLLTMFIISIYTDVSFAANLVVECPSIKIFVSGKQVKFKSVPITINGEILLNANELLVNLGIPDDNKHITVDKNKKKIVINSGNYSIKMTTNSAQATVDKSSKVLNTAPIVYKNKYYIPVKSTVQLLDKKFAWDVEQKSVYIQKVSDYNKVKSTLDKAIAATKATDKYIANHLLNTTSYYKDDPSVSKGQSVCKVDKNKMIMTINSYYEDSYFGQRTNQHYIFNSYLYSKYSNEEKWQQKELLSKKDYGEWILNYDVSKFKISDILYCGLTIKENIKENSIILKGPVYLHVNKKEYNFEPVDMYLEFIINKSNNLINKITHNYSEYQDSNYSGRYLYTSKETFEYKEYNGAFIVEIPDESKMEFEDPKGKSDMNVAPFELSNEEESKIGDLSSSINKVAVDGAWKHPYNIDVTQAIMFIVIRNQNDFNTFSNLSDNAQKVFINQIVQDNYGEYIGCETVYGLVYFKGEIYTGIITGYSTAPENVRLEKYDEGFEITIIVQDKKNNSYKNYE